MTPRTESAALPEDWRPRGMLCDLLSALVDSWTLWDDIAGSSARGREWRLEYLRLTYGIGGYVPYLDLVRDSAVATGLPGESADRIDERWEELAPWPEGPEVLRHVSQHAPVGVVTNCSRSLGERAASLLGIPSLTVTTAEEVGVYKPEAPMYRSALAALGLDAADVLYVAGSPGDVAGARAVGMHVVWHNRIGLDDASARAGALAVIGELGELLRFFD